MAQSTRIICFSLLSVLSLACSDETTAPGATTTTTTTTTTTDTTTTTEPPELPPPMGDLPPPGHVETDRFATSDVCAQCHLAGDPPTLHDAAGRDVSPVYLWRSSMMGLAARDPFYLAVFSDELLKHSGASTAIERTCTRCHAPAASLEHEQIGGHLSFEAMTSLGDDTAVLGRDGVTCSMCHQIADNALGTTPSYTGGFEVGFNRLIYGPHMAVNQDPMMFFADYTPTYSAHSVASSLCATCHTVIVRPLDENGVPTGGELVEQAPYFEWRNSTYNDEGGGTGVACIGCHMPTDDEDGNPITSPLSKQPATLLGRQPFGRHILVGGNAYMLELMADNIAWTGSGLNATELQDSAARSRTHLSEAAELTLVSSAVSGTDLEVVLRIDNKAGHKLPTGYPSRRMWLHLKALDAGGAVLFESGAVAANGTLVDPGGNRLDSGDVVMPHHDVIDAEDKVQVYEAIAVDAAGVPTHLALGASHFAKDNRILPLGWSNSHSDAAKILPVGVDADGNHTGGSDEVRYRIGAGASVTKIEVELLYQTVTPAIVEKLSIVPTGAAVKFVQMVTGKPPTPVTMATLSADI
jgi:cytochrome c553